MSEFVRQCEEEGGGEEDFDAEATRLVSSSDWETDGEEVVAGTDAEDEVDGLRS